MSIMERIESIRPKKREEKVGRYDTMA